MRRASWKARQSAAGDDSTIGSPMERKRRLKGEHYQSFPDEVSNYLILDPAPHLPQVPELPSREEGVTWPAERQQVRV
jgi:hypothetical protein